MPPQRPVTEKYLTIAGAVAEPVTLRVPVGVTLAQCVAAAGGPTVPDANYIVGGVMMGYLEENHDALVDKTTGGVIVLPDEHVVVRRRRQDWQQIVRIGRSACDQCSFCTELCPRWLLGHPIEPHRAMRSLEFNLIGEANVDRHAVLLRVQPVQPLLLPRGPGPQERLHAEQTPAGGREEAVGKAAVQSRAAGAAHRQPQSAHGAADDQAWAAAVPQRRAAAGYAPAGRPRGRQTETAPRRPCEPLVGVGQRVTKGQVIGRPPVANGKPALGAPVHASIDGVVTAVENGVVWIEKNMK